MNKQVITKNKKNIIINYYCFCKKKYFQEDKICFLLPCSHMFHNNCIQNKTHCPICNEKIKKILTEDKIFSSSKYLNYQNDITTVKINNSGSINYVILPLRIINVITYINTLILSKTTSDLINGEEFLFKFIGIKINIIDNTTNKNQFQFKNNIFKWLNNNNKIIITNHSHYLDVFILFYIFRCGFIASEFLTSTQLGRLIAYVCKVLIFKRGVDTNMVEKIKDYLKEQKQIVIFPEGLMKDNNNSLLRFRTGAFYTGADICPIVIKYRNYVHDVDMVQALFKIITQPEIIVDVHILDIEYPPFNDKKIEKIRKKMAKIGNLKLSRVSNRDIKA